MVTTLLGLASLPLLLAVVVLVLRSPLGVGLPLFAVVVPFGDRLDAGSSPFTSLSSLLGLVITAALLLRLATGGRAVRRLPADMPWWLLFLGLVCASWIWSIDRAITLRGALVLGSLVLLYFLVAVTPIDRVALRRTENALVLGAVAAVGYGLTQLLFLGGFPSEVNGQVIVAPGTGRFGNDLLGPNIQALAMLPPLAICLQRALVPGDLGTVRRGRLLYPALALVMVLGIVMTASRTGLITAAVSVLFVVSNARPEARRKAFALVALGVLLAAVLWVAKPGGLANRTYESATSSSGRLDIWRVGAAGCSRYCLTGSGWGTFPDVYAELQATVPGARVLVGGGAYQAHNLFLLVAVEVGILGLVLLLLGLGSVGLEAWRLPRDRRGAPVAACAATAVGVFFLSSMEFKFFWLVLMLVAINRNLVTSDAGPPLSAGPPSGAAGEQAASTLRAGD